MRRCISFRGYKNAEDNPNPALVTAQRQLNQREGVDLMKSMTFDTKCDLWRLFQTFPFSRFYLLSSLTYVSHSELVSHTSNMTDMKEYLSISTTFLTRLRSHIMCIIHCTSSQSQTVFKKIFFSFTCEAPDGFSCFITVKEKCHRFSHDDHDFS